MNASGARGQFTHELVADITALLMSRRRCGALAHGTADAPRGYTVATKQDVEEILAIEAELLRSEGVDPRCPGFAEARKTENHRQG